MREKLLVRIYLFSLPQKHHSALFNVHGLFLECQTVNAICDKIKKVHPFSGHTRRASGIFRIAKEARRKRGHPEPHGKAFRL
ncbi:MAG: hypothetical protein ACOY15_00915 [Pseudomonadota bacterium]